MLGPRITPIAIVFNRDSIVKITRKHMSDTIDHVVLGRMSERIRVTQFDRITRRMKVSKYWFRVMRMQALRNRFVTGRKRKEVLE